MNHNHTVRHGFVIAALMVLTPLLRAIQQKPFLLPEQPLPSQSIFEPEPGPIQKFAKEFVEGVEAFLLTEKPDSEKSPPAQNNGLAQTGTSTPPEQRRSKIDAFMKEVNFDADLFKDVEKRGPGAGEYVEHECNAGHPFPIVSVAVSKEKEFFSLGIGRIVDKGIGLRNLGESEANATVIPSELSASQQCKRVAKQTQDAIDLSRSPIGRLSNRYLIPLLNRDF